MREEERSGSEANETETVDTPMYLISSAHCLYIPNGDYIYAVPLGTTSTQGEMQISDRLCEMSVCWLSAFGTASTRSCLLDVTEVA